MISLKKNKVFLLLITLIICFISRNIYYDYKFRNIENTAISSQEEANNQSKVDLDYLNQLSKSNRKIKSIIENKNKYPQVLLEMLARNIDMTDYVLEYEENRGQVFSDTIGTVQKGQYPLLLQYDKRWGYGIYKDDVIAINGCGPTSLAIILAGLTGRNDITPYDIALYSASNGYYQSGTSWSFFTEGVQYFGIKGTEISLSKSNMMLELENDHPIICSMGRGDFTTTGHIIVITGIKDGKFIVRDPNSKERSNKLWSYEKIAPQIKNLWSYQRLYA